MIIIQHPRKFNLKFFPRISCFADKFPHIKHYFRKHHNLGIPHLIVVPLPQQKPSRTFFTQKCQNRIRTIHPFISHQSPLEVEVIISPCAPSSPVDLRKVLHIHLFIRQQPQQNGNLYFPFRRTHGQCESSWGKSTNLRERHFNVVRIVLLFRARDVLHKTYNFALL